MNTERVHFWTAVVMAGAAALMVLLAVGAFVFTTPTGLSWIAYVIVGATNLVAATVSGLVVRQRLTGRGAVNEEIAGFGSMLSIVSATLLSNAATAIDESDWRVLFFGLGAMLAATGFAMAAVAPRTVRVRLG